MIQVAQDVGSGRTTTRQLPDPIAAPGTVLVAHVASLISAGTERHVVQLAKSSLLSKARQRPQEVRRILEKVRAEGLATTIRQVREKLDEPMPLGYSAAGVVIECGAHVSRFKPGDRVATAAPHAALAVVPQNLCAAIPDGVSFEQAAYGSVGAIALQGIRLGRVSLGERVLVIGLGLVGQIAVALLKAHGCQVFATDVDPGKLDQARRFGADVVSASPSREAIQRFSGGFGVDAAIITAATDSNGPIELAAESCRSKGRIVLVGVAGLNLPRPPFFQKELEFTVSSSLGAGRGDPIYEEKGVDYPIGYARWTAQRNLQAILDTIAAGTLPVDALTTHRFAIERAPEAYDLITGRREPYVGVILQYGEPEARRARRIDLPARAARTASGAGISLIGAGNFARLILMPALGSAPDVRLRGICTAKGLNAVHTGEKYGFAFAATDVKEIVEDAETTAVVIATRHHLHADLAIVALRAGKHVFVEKPLCLTHEELDRISACVTELGDACPVLMVGFNRRFARATGVLRRHFDGIEPLSVSFRFSVGEIPPNAWPQDVEVGGGRIVGEACHAIDTCAAIVGSPAVRVFAESAGQVGGVQTTDDRVFITLRHANGAVSNISYQAGGDRSGPTERLEVFGGGRTAVVDAWDAVDLWANGRHSTERGGKDKGHAAELQAFLHTVRTGGDWPIPWTHVLGSTWASLAAVDSLRSGMPIEFA